MSLNGSSQILLTKGSSGSMKTSSVGRPTFNLTDLSSIKFRYRYKIKDLNGSIEGGFVIENQEKRDLYS